MQRGPAGCHPGSIPGKAGQIKPARRPGNRPPALAAGMPDRRTGRQRWRINARNKNDSGRTGRGKAETMGINSIIAVYLAAKAAEAEANKKARTAKAEAEKAAAEIMRYAAGRTGFDTDLYTVAMTKETRVILDQGKLFADFPGIKDLDQYGKESTRDVITALERHQAETVSA